MKRTRNRAAFTLVEVVAAVALLGICYVVLFQAGSEAALREGESRRRLQASLLADRELAEIELAIARDRIPSIGATRRREGDYGVEIEVTPFAFAVPEPESGRRRSPPPDAGSLLGDAARPNGSPLRHIEVRVRWSEGTTERSVRRTSFALDTQQAAPALEELSLGGRVITQ